MSPRHVRATSGLTCHPGHLGLQLVLSRLLTPADRTLLEHAHYFAQLMWTTWYMLILQAYRIRSAYLFAILTGVLFLGALGHEASRIGKRVRHRMDLFAGYVFPLSLLVAMGVEAATTTLDIFVPLAGRMGKDAPAEFIVATISSVWSFTFLPVAIPLFHRLSRRGQRRVFFSLILFTSVVIAWFSQRWPYDPMHPKRVGVQFSFNVSPRVAALLTKAHLWRLNSARRFHGQGPFGRYHPGAARAVRLGRTPTRTHRPHTVRLGLGHPLPRVVLPRHVPLQAGWRSRIRLATHGLERRGHGARRRSSSPFHAQLCESGGVKWCRVESSRIK